jgi:hypothetical protein
VRFPGFGSLAASTPFLGIILLGIVLAWLKAAASLNTQFVALAESDGARLLLAKLYPSRLASDARSRRDVRRGACQGGAGRQLSSRDRNMGLRSVTSVRRTCFVSCTSSPRSQGLSSVCARVRPYNQPLPLLVLKYCATRCTPERLV